jgi:predicted dehydrogenase
LKIMPLRLALLGLDSDVLALARAAQALPEFQVAIVCDTTSPSDELRGIAPLARYEPHWESLLLENQVDAVIVATGGDGEVSAEQLRKLVQAKVPLLVVTPACESIVGFEVDMIRGDTGCVVLPYVPGVKHPAVAELANIVAAGSTSPLGKVEQLVFERKLLARDRESVLAQLARDAGLSRAIVGNITKVSAMGVAASETPFASLSVNLSGPAGILVRWSAGPIEHESLGKVTLLGEKGMAALLMSADERKWRLDDSTLAQASRTWPDSNSPAAALYDLARALAGKAPSPTWLDACRDVEVAETAERSAIRGRTIELYQEEHSEEGTFKGVMSVGGCIMLAIALVGLLASFAVGGVQMLLRDPDVKVEHEPWPLWLRLWPVYPLAIFLLLQLLQLVFHRARTVQPAKSAESAD